MQPSCKSGESIAHPLLLHEDTKLAALRRAGVTPVGMGLDTEGYVTLHGERLDHVAAQHGTPLYLYDLATIRHQVAQLHGGLGGITPYTLIYACKAMLCKGLARLLLELDFHFDAVSEGEMGILLASGVPPNRISLHGNAKSDAELRMCLSRGMTINVDSEYELERILTLASEGPSENPTTNLLIRVIPSVDAHTHKAIATGGATSKFGVTPEQAMAMAQRICRASIPSLRFVGFHAHVGSQIFTPEDHLLQLDVMLDLVQGAGVPVTQLNVGGGFGARYTPPDTPDLVSLHEYVRHLATRFVEGCARRGISPAPHLLFEPGRCIVARAGVTLYSVVGTKPHVCAVDGGMGDNLRAALYDARYSVFCARLGAHAHNYPIDVVGRFCESGDVIARQVPLPKTTDMQRGDIVVVCTTGAYHHSMNTTYNAVPRPAVVAMEGEDGDRSKCVVWVRRETLEDLLQRDL